MATNARNRTVIIVMVCVFLLLIISFVLTSRLWLSRDLKEQQPISKHIIFFRLHDDLKTDVPSMEIGQTIQDIAIKHDLVITKVGFKQAALIMFETLNDVDNNMRKLAFPSSMTHVYGVRGTDRIASKSGLAFTLKRALPRDVVDRIMPETFILDNAIDIDGLRREFSPDNVYVMKKNIQQQKGFLITCNLDEILAAWKRDSGYVVVQKMLQDPFVLDGHKVNLRVYMLVVVGVDGAVRVYYYNDGFMYYTIDPFVANSTNPREVITTGLAGRNMYKGKPLTHKDFSAYLGARQAAKLRSNMTELIRHIKIAYEPVFVEENKGLPGTKFLIYGVDVAPDRKLECKVMEVNKGPDLSYKDARDRELKMSMVYDAMVVANLVSGSGGGGNFIKVY